MLTTSHAVWAVVVIVAAQVGLALWLRSAMREPRVPSPGPATGPAPGPRGDDFRSYQAVATEVAKRQVAVLADVADAVQAFERACFEHGRKLCEQLAAEWRRAGAVGVPAGVPNDLDAVIRFFVLGAERPLDEAAQHRIRKDLEAEVTVLQKYREETTSLLESDIFWLGIGLEKELRRYVIGMGEVFSAASGHPKDLRASAERFRTLVENHPNASAAIDRLSARSGARPPGSESVG